MKSILRLAICGILLIPILVSGQNPKTKVRKPLTDVEQAKFLSTRLPGNTIEGTFDSYCGFLHDAINVVIHSEDEEINSAELHSPFPDFYTPTWRELFNTIGLQTGSSWRYDSQIDVWIFAKPAMRKPFTITVADKWIQSDEEGYVKFTPPTYPVGMDVYYKGSYSADDKKDAESLYLKVRDVWAIEFASGFKQDVSVKDMKTVTVDGAEALYFESPAPLHGVIWRQWVLVKDGKAFIIVSSLLPAHTQLLSDVQAMVKSFHVISQ